MATKMSSTQLLVRAHTLRRARLLAIVRGEKVAEVWRMAVEGGGLDPMEARHARELQMLQAVLDQIEPREGVDPVEVWIRNGKTFDEITAPRD